MLHAALTQLAVLVVVLLGCEQHLNCTVQVYDFLFTIIPCCMLARCLVHCPSSTGRLRCDVSNAGGIVAAVAAASPNLAQLELHCRDDLNSSCYSWNLAGAAAPSSHRAFVMCRGLLELPSGVPLLLLT